MHVGLIVGIGPAAADYYYRSILAAAGERGAALELTMAHADIRTLLRNLAAGDKAAQVTVYLRLADRLARAGAEAVAVTSIGGSFCIDAFMPVSPLPVIDLLEEVDRGVAERGYRKVGVIGTRVAMQTRLTAPCDRPSAVPEGEMLDRVHDPTRPWPAGAVTEAQHATFLEAGHGLMARGAEAVMLGGTDLALAFTGEPPFPLFDCAGVHAAAIARRRWARARRCSGACRCPRSSPRPPCPPASAGRRGGAAGDDVAGLQRHLLREQGHDARRRQDHVVWRGSPGGRGRSARPGRESDDQSSPVAIAGPTGPKLSQPLARAHCGKAGSALSQSSAVTSFTQVRPKMAAAASSSAARWQRRPMTRPSSPSKRTRPS